MSKQQHLKTRSYRNKRWVSIITLTCLLFCGSLWLKANAPDHNVSWKSWVAGKSVSADFHYFDLLELLFTLRHSD